MTHHITDELIFEAAEEHSNSSAGPVGETSDFWVFEREDLLVFVHHVLALAAPAPAVPEDVARAGAALANIAFNLAQCAGQTIDAGMCLSMDTARKRWDASIDAARAAEKGGA